MSDDLYAALHVTPEAGARDIKKAYFGLVRQFPPETHPEEFQRLRAAYDVLSNVEARKAYDASRGVAASAQLGDELAAIMQGALAAMAAEEWDRAVPLLEGVVKERPDAQEARMRLCGCLLNLRRLNEAAQHAAELARHHPTLAQAPLLAGYAAQGLKRFSEARAHFVRASELDPLDFRPIRSVADVDLQQDDPEAALAFIDARLATAPESMRLGLRMERISVLHFACRLTQADEALDALEREATTAELKEELGWFYEREAAAHFARTRHQRADALLARLRAVAPARGSVALTRPVTLPLHAVPQAALAWLLEQRERPQLFFNPGAGLLTDSAVLLAVCAPFAAMAAVAFSADSQWATSTRVMLGLLFAGAGGLLGAVGLRWVSSLLSPVGAFSTVHRLYFIDVSLDEVRFMPMVRLSAINATHQGTNGVYSHTTFSLSFGDQSRSFTVASRPRAEELGQLLHQLRGRLLDLLHSGMLAGEEGAELLPSTLFDRPLPPRPSRRPRWVLGGAALGLALSLWAGALAERASEEQRWLAVLADPRPGPLRAYLAADPPQRFVAPARAALTAAKAEAIKRLQVTAPRLARALEGSDPAALTPLFLALSGAPGPVTLVPPAGSKLAAMPESEFLPAAFQRHEAELIDALQAKVDRQAGAGWFALRAGTGPLTLKLAYRLSLSGGAYRFKAAGPPAPVLWPEAVLEGTATLGEEQQVVVAKSARVVRLSDSILSAISQGDSASAGQLVFQSAWAELASQLSRLLGVG